MELKNLEAVVANKLDAKIKEAIAATIVEVNTLGYDYHAVDETLTTWLDPQCTDLLTINIAIATDFVPTTDYAKGDHRKLNLDIAQGGFWQFYRQQGLAGMAETIAQLHRTRNIQGAMIVTSAYEILSKYEQLRANLDHLDRDFTNLTATIPRSLS